MHSLMLNSTVPLDFLKGVVSEVSSETMDPLEYESDGTEITILAATKYYFRTNDRVGFFLVSSISNGKQRIDLSAIGGGSGLLGITLGATARYEEEVFLNLDKKLSEQGITYEEIKK